MKVIPAIDLREGRVVRLRQGDFGAMRAFEHDAVALAECYVDAGADWIHVVDLDGAALGAPVQLDLVARIVATGARVQAGGGVRMRAHVEQLLACGVARVVVGSVAARTPEAFAEWIDAFGAVRLCLALDVRRGIDGALRVAVDAWRGDVEIDCAALLDRHAAAGLCHALCTDIARDGMQRGPNVAFYRELAARWPTIEWIASGGVRDRHDIDRLAATGVAACVAGTALLEGTLALEEIARCSRAA
jgi:phosphoribosylformimino-5-aminoimidazole carboxamide ribotide isomerase